jgi:hypothetical protein
VWLLSEGAARELAGLVAIEDAAGVHLGWTEKRRERSLTRHLRVDHGRVAVLEGVQ